MLKSLLGLALLATLPFTALAADELGSQQRSRTLAVPAANSWQHAETELILRPTIAGLRRGPIQDNGQDEVDVFSTYRGEDGVIATIYIFRSGLPNASIWFDRALTSLQSNPAFQVGAAQPTGTIVPAAGAPQGLLASFDFARPAGGGTALALMPISDGFLFKVRMSSNNHRGAALRERMTQLLGEIRWPSGAAALGLATRQIAACPQPLRFRRARMLEGDVFQGLISALASAAPRARPIDGTFCRDASSNARAGVYRLNAASDAYILALGDAGLALSAEPAFSAPGMPDPPRRGQTSLTLLDRRGAAVLPSFDRLPAPDQALQALAGGGSRMQVRVQPGR